MSKKEEQKKLIASLEEGILEIEGLNKHEKKEIIDKLESAVDPEQSDLGLFEFPPIIPTEDIAPNLSSDLTQLNWETVPSAPDIGFAYEEKKLVEEPKEPEKTNEILLKDEKSSNKSTENIKDDLIKEAEQIKQILEDEIQEIINFINTQKGTLEKKFDESLAEHDKHKFQILLDLSKDVKDVCASGVKTLKKDFQNILNNGKAKWDKAMKEIQNIEPNKISDDSLIF